MALSGGSAVRLSDRIVVSPPFLSQDGHHVAVAIPAKEGTVDLAILSADTGTLEAQHRVPPTLDQSSPAAASWMPDNLSMAIVDTRNGTPNLWSTPVLGDSGPQKQLTHFTSGLIWSFCFSRDGKSLIMARGSNQSDVVLFTTPK